jgi:hypothetical protein
MLRLRKMERIVEPDYAMDGHKTMTPETSTSAAPVPSAPVPATEWTFVHAVSRLL